MDIVVLVISTVIMLLAGKLPPPKEAEFDPARHYEEKSRRTPSARPAQKATSPRQTPMTAKSDSPIAFDTQNMTQTLEQLMSFVDAAHQIESVGEHAYTPVTLRITDDSVISGCVKLSLSMTIYDIFTSIYYDKEHSYLITNGKTTPKFIRLSDFSLTPEDMELYKGCDESFALSRKIQAYCYSCFYTELFGVPENYFSAVEYIDSYNVDIDEYPEGDVTVTCTFLHMEKDSIPKRFAFLAERVKQKYPNITVTSSNNTIKFHF